MYETVDIQGNPEVRAKATAKVDTQQQQQQQQESLFVLVLQQKIFTGKKT